MIDVSARAGSNGAALHWCPTDTKPLPAIAPSSQRATDMACRSSMATTACWKGTWIHTRPIVISKLKRTGAHRESAAHLSTQAIICVMDTPRHKWLTTLAWRAGPVAARKPDCKGSIGPGWHLKCPQTLAHVPLRLALPCPFCRAHRILERWWTVNQAPGRKMLPGPIAAPEIACYLHKLNLAGQFGTLSWLPTLTFNQLGVIVTSPPPQ
jgi:hypothetical protein